MELGAIKNIPRQSIRWAARRCKQHGHLHVNVPGAAALRSDRGPARFAAVRGVSASAGMDAFMEFEREMARKKRPAQPRPTRPLPRPTAPRDDECCKLDCPNCVLLVYQEKLLEYELSLQDGGDGLQPEPLVHRWDIAFLGAEPSELQLEQLEANNRMLYRVARNDLISAPHKTKDNYWRSVRHIELHVDDVQQASISDDASNIAVYVPNASHEVDRMVAHLHVDPDLMFTVADTQAPREGTAMLTTRERPFASIGSVRDALTWCFDLESTPRSRVLRQLAAFATDESDRDALVAPNASESISVSRRGQTTTFADLLAMFPSVRLDFQTLYQLAPVNAPRYYTVSSSRRLYPDTVSITLGLRDLASQPVPRCSSYLSAMVPGVDTVRASFFQSTFVFPRQDRRPLMLISAGTGIAPFRAFLQDLQHEQAASSRQNHRHAFLFYGCRRADTDFLYQDEIQRTWERGDLDQLHVEFSDQPGRPKRYVQDALAEQAELVASHLLEHDGYIFICGSVAMGRAVKLAIVEALQQCALTDSPVEAARRLQPQLSAPHTATAFWEHCIETNRIVTELW